MQNKKLTSMVEFVLYANIKSITPLKDIVNYANFLKQPLELWMFVPCDDNGNFLEEKSMFNNTEEDYIFNSVCFDKYQQAKERCLFKGFEFEKVYNWGFELKISFDGFEEYIDFINEDTIEDLLTYSVDFEWELTATAKKQLGL